MPNLTSMALIQREWVRDGSGRTWVSTLAEALRKGEMGKTITFPQTWVSYGNHADVKSVPHGDLKRQDFLHSETRDLVESKGKSR